MDLIRDYYYEIVENGYYIKDRNDVLFKLYQYENEKEDYILYRTDKSDKDYAKYAQMHIDAMLKADAEAEKERVSVGQLSKELDLTKMAIDEIMMISIGGDM